MDKEKREQLAARIRALMAMITARGATEGEAQNAASLARKLMDKHNITLTEAQLREEPVVKERKMGEGRNGDTARKAMAVGIADFTDTKVWLEGENMYGIKSTYYVFLGAAPDVQFAHWLMDSLTEFCLRGAKQHGGNGDARKSFIQGAAYRISDRLKAEAAARKADKVGGTALVVVTKQALIAEWVAANNLRLRKGAGTTGGRNADAYRAGQQHGEKARWDRPVGMDKHRNLE